MSKNQGSLFIYNNYT